MNVDTAERELAKERHRNLDVWKEAVELASAIYSLTANFPHDEIWGLTSQLRRAAVSVPSNIAEGSKRSMPDFKKFLTYSLGSLAEIDTQLIIAEMQGYAEYDADLKTKIMALTAMIRSFSATLR